MKRIERVRKNDKGEITDVMIDGKVYNIEEAVNIIRGDIINGVTVTGGENREAYLKRNLEEHQVKELDNLPSF